MKFGPAVAVSERLPSFEAVVLNLIDDRDLDVLTAALSEFALNNEAAARDTEDRSVVAGAPDGIEAADALQRLADRALVLLGKIEHQVRAIRIPAPLPQGQPPLLLNFGDEVRDE